MVCVFGEHSYVLIPASRSYWPIPKPPAGEVNYHRVCLKCMELTSCYICKRPDEHFRKCVGCTFDVCDEFQHCEYLVSKFADLLSWVEGLHSSTKGV